MEDQDNALDLVQDAIEAIQDALAAPNLTTAERNSLAGSLAHMNDIERSIIRKMEGQLVDVLRADSVGLKNLAKDLQKTSDRLDNVANSIGKAADGVNIAISAIIGAAGAGIL